LTPKRVAVIIGTRPDVIKQASPYVALKKYHNFDTLLIHSGQHSEMGVQAQRTFNLVPDHTCKILDDDKLRLGDLVSRLISEFTVAFYEFKPALVLVHGDTTTAFAAATAAFLQNIPVGHVEAGLRTSRFEYPFPEEGYRRAISRFTTLHFSPTTKSAQNLREEGINNHVYVTGNTVVDALHKVLDTTIPMRSRLIRSWVEQDQCSSILVTCHRRESYGEPLKQLCDTLKRIVESTPYVKVIWPVHSNPVVRDAVLDYLEHERILLDTPLDYVSFAHTMNFSQIIITDSGGVMEEAAVLGKPTLVLRDETERPECLDLDCVRLVGYEFNTLEEYVRQWIVNCPKTERNTIFGDGSAGEEIAEIVAEYLS
jgi:UDP-N-acetylglucosamine 2-epimerase (non-hydrolysing)